MFDNITYLDRLLFTRHLAVMIRSGIPIYEAISSIADQSSNPAFKRILLKISAEIGNGQTLQKSLSGYPRVFDPFYLNLIGIGERSGNLEKNLDYLALQMKKEYEFRGKIASASVYPAIVLITAFLVGGGVSLFVLPKIISLFAGYDTNLPIATKILLYIAGVMQNYGFYIFGGIALFVILFRLTLIIPGVRKIWQGFLLSLPVIGPFIQNSEMTFMCRNLGIMLKSGVDITEALRIQRDSTQNLIYKDYITTLIKEVESGKTIVEGITSRHLKYFSKIAEKMVGVGEKTGKLDESFLYLGDFFEEETDNASKNFSTVLEPILLLIVGLVVAFLALAIITPIYQFTGSIGR